MGILLLYFCSTTEAITMTLFDFPENVPFRFVSTENGETDINTFTVYEKRGNRIHAIEFPASPNTSYILTDYVLWNVKKYEDNSK